MLELVSPLHTSVRIMATLAAPQAPATCNSCGTLVARQEILYSSEGNVVCAACNAKSDLLETDKRAALNIRTAAITSLIAGFVCVFFNPLFFPMVMAIASGGYALKSMLPGNERFTQHLTKATKTAVWILACLGLAFAALRLLLEFVFVTFILS